MEGSDITWRRDIQSKAITYVEEQFETVPLMQELAELRQHRADVENDITQLSRVIIAKLRGVDPEDVPDMETLDRRRRNNYYGSRDDLCECFERYPGDASEIMFELAVDQRDAMINAHPTGAKLAELDELEMRCMDRITTCGTHRQMQEVWEDIQSQLNIFDEETEEQRRPRRVSTARANGDRQQQGSPA